MPSLWRPDPALDEGWPSDAKDGSVLLAQMLAKSQKAIRGHRAQRCHRNRKETLAKWGFVRGHPMTDRPMQFDNPTITDCAPLRLEKAVRLAVYTPKAVAERWQCSERHVRNLISAGQLRAFRLGGKLLRITSDAVEEFQQ
jgi:excisionase family DNA binding protein